VAKLRGLTIREVLGIGNGSESESKDGEPAEAPAAAEAASAAEPAAEAEPAGAAEPAAAPEAG
jgi:hypothetical protein